MRARGLPTATRTGATALAAAIALGVLGVALGYSTLTVAAVATVGALVLSWIVTVRLPDLEVIRAIEPERVERGQAALGLVAVRNRGRRRTRPCAAVDRVAGQEIDVDVPGLAAGRSTSVPYRLPTNRRGAVTVGPLSLVRRDPFGLWQARRQVGSSTTLLVQPRVYAIEPRPVGRTAHLEGPTSDSAPRGTLAFHSLREYVAGDDIRRIHWRSTARTGTVMVREHVDTSLPSTVVVLDTRGDRYDGDGFEDAVDLAASVVAASQQRGFPIRFVTSGGATLSSRAGERAQGIRDLLASIQPAPTGDLMRAATEARRGRDRDAIVVVAGRVDTADLSTMTDAARGFGTSVLVTIRGAGGGARWPAGVHLDGPSAEAVVARWRLATTPRGGGGR